MWNRRMKLVSFLWSWSISRKKQSQNKLGVRLTMIVTKSVMKKKWLTTNKSSIKERKRIMIWNKRSMIWVINSTVAFATWSCIKLFLWCLAFTLTVGVASLIGSKDLRSVLTVESKCSWWRRTLSWITILKATCKWTPS